MKIKWKQTKHVHKYLQKNMEYDRDKYILFAKHTKKKKKKYILSACIYSAGNVRTYICSSMVGRKTNSKKTKNKNKRKEFMNILHSSKDYFRPIETLISLRKKCNEMTKYGSQ